MRSDFETEYSPSEESLERLFDDDSGESVIHVIMVEPGKMAREADIGTDLSELQEAVGGGYIETCYAFENEACCIVCNDEGKINGSRPNRALYDDKGRIKDIVFGPFFICDCSRENFGSLSEEQVSRYKERFLKPEHFYMVGNEIKASQYTPRAEKGAR